MELAIDDTGELAQAALGGGCVIGPHALLGSIDPGCAGGAEQGILDVDGDADWRQAEGRVWGGDAVEAPQVSPLGDGGVLSVEELPSQGVGESEAGVVGGAAADADEAGAGVTAGGGAEDGGESGGIEGEGVEASWGEHGEADHAGGLDDGEAPAGVEPPDGLEGAVGGVDGADDISDGSEMAGEEGSEAVAAVTDGEGVEAIVGPGLAPALGDGPGRVGCGEGAFELVRGNQDPEGGLGSGADGFHPTNGFKC